MGKTLRRSVSVFIAVSLTTLLVYGVVRAGGAVFPAATATASVTPSASQDSAVAGQRSTAASQDSATASQRSTTSSQGSSGSSARLYVCPVSGCTANSCHGATGAPPPSR